MPLSKPEIDLKPSDKSDEVLRFLRERRSSLAKAMDCDGEGPDAQQLVDILEVSARVPDHRKLVPFRFVTFTGPARADFDEVIVDRFKALNPDASDKDIKIEALRFMRAHTVVAVISTPKACAKGTPKWEQVLSSGAVCFQMLLAARAMGFAAQWLSEWYAYDERIKTALGLGPDDEFAGFIYIASCDKAPKERDRPDVNVIVSHWRK